MKNVLKLSATAIILAGANMLFSQSALAHTTVGDLHNQQSLCSYGYNPNCSSNGSYSGSGYNVYYTTNYLAVVNDRNHKPFFFKKTYRKYDQVWRDEYWQEADNEALAKCNASNKRSPCKFLSSVVHDGCIAYLDTPDVFYNEPANTCAEAKQAINDRCMARYNDPKICKGIKTKKP